MEWSFQLGCSWFLEPYNFSIQSSATGNMKRHFPWHLIKQMPLGNGVYEKHWEKSWCLRGPTGSCPRQIETRISNFLVSWIAARFLSKTFKLATFLIIFGVFAFFRRLHFQFPSYWCFDFLHRNTSLPFLPIFSLHECVYVCGEKVCRLIM